MCGIAGRTGRRALTPLPLDDAWCLLDRRGPDGRGQQAWSEHASSWELLHTRLAINDLSPAGNQPIANEDGSLVMVFNGEIYNSPELRRHCEAAGHSFRSSMDGEVILHLWEMEGPSALRRLNGIFALALASTVSGEVVLARDPLGVKPLFYTLDGDNSMWFASELTTLAALSAPLGGDDLVGLAQFLTFLWIPDPRTPHENVRSLLPGHMLRWSPARADVMPYGEPLQPPDGEDVVSEEEAVAGLSDRFCAAAERQLLSDVPVGLMASGGIDSGLLWWAMGPALDRAYTIAWGADQSGEDLGSDATAVAELERRFGNPVDRVDGEGCSLAVLPPTGDLFADPAYGLTRVIAQHAQRDGLKVLVSGQGGDELFGGYRRHLVARLLERVHLGELGVTAARGLARLPFTQTRVEYLSRLARAASEDEPFARYMQLCTYSNAADRARILGCAEADVADDVVWHRHREVYESLPPHVSFLRKVMTVDLRVYLPGLGLAYVDRGGMEFGVEIRVPWLDLDLVRWSLALPERLLVRQRQGKWLTRQLAARAISGEFANRPKRGFGAPATYIQPGQAGTGTRGFRQDRYLNLAVSILDGRVPSVALLAKDHRTERA